MLRATMFSLTRVSSAAPTTDTSDDAFRMAIISLMTDGIAARKRLRQEDMPPRLHRAVAEGAGRGGLAARNHLEAAAKILRLIGRRAKRQAEGAGEKGREFEPDERKQVIDHQQLDQERNAAEHAT